MNAIKDLIARSDEKIRDVLQVIDKNGRGICFIVDSSSSLKILGVATDGDIRRGLLRGQTLDSPITSVMNQKYIFLPVESDEILIRSHFNSDVKVIPLLDSNGSIVEFADTLRSHRIPVLEPELCGNEEDYLIDCVRSNWISSQGPYVVKFERQFEEMHQNMHAVSTSNGTTALHLALAALGIKAGDEVIVPNITFAATVNAVLYCGATPVLCEVEAGSWCIDITEVKKLITKKTRAVIPVHLYGQVCNMNKLSKLAREYNLFIIEDCAESLGSQIGSRLVGSYGDASTFSFFGNKTISTGEGGMVLFNNKHIANLAKILRDHGMTPGKKYWHETVGYNYRLTNLQAAVGVAQMERFESILAKKINIAQTYSELLMDVSGIDSLPLKIDGVVHSNWLYTVMLAPHIDRDRLINELLQYGIETRPVFYPLNEMPPYKNFRASNDLKNSKNLSARGISLPTSLSITSLQIKYVVRVLQELLSDG